MKQISNRVMSDFAHGRVIRMADSIVEHLKWVHNDGAMGATLYGDEFRDRLAVALTDVAGALSCEIQGAVAAVKRCDPEEQKILLAIAEAMKK
jgi:hypothetical protein